MTGSNAAAGAPVCERAVGGASPAAAKALHIAIYRMFVDFMYKSNFALCIFSGSCVVIDVARPNADMRSEPAGGRAAA
ncbi:hypothetical protein [Methylopila sp. 73B]|uniref:hypothetical protein n=1 Tax=Methylopila sp. 73B TaxID=1120792 RepID=UPI0012DC34C9|nr:hypothetical protein [Methylopila sp. 73B]